MKMSEFLKACVHGCNIKCRSDDFGRVMCRMMDDFRVARISAPGVVDNAVV